MSDDHPHRHADGPPVEHALAAALRRHREAAGLSVGQLATLVSYTREHVSRAERPGRGLASAPLVEAIDAALDAGGALVALRARADEGRRARRPQGRPARTRPDSHGDPDPVTALAATLARTDVGEDELAEIDQAVASLAACHTAAPARVLLAQAVGLHERLRVLLGGRLRLRQRREAYRILSDLLAHACLLLGDLDQAAVAERWGRAGLAYAREAQCWEALPRTALAKTLRWQGRHVESADMARLGLRSSPPGPVRIQLACQEANAAALLGHADRARAALAHARHAAATAPAASGMSAWSFPPARLALFAQSVARHTGDPDAALAATAEADAHWRAGHVRVTATWAQVRLGAAITQAQRGVLDGAAHESGLVLAFVAPEQRVSTVTGYVDGLAQALTGPRYAGSGDAAELAARCRAFTAAALPGGPAAGDSVTRG